MLKNDIFKASWLFFISTLGVLFSGMSAANLELSDLSNSYSNCITRDNGNGTTTFSLSVDYKDATGHLAGNTKLLSRGALLYSYDKSGKPTNVLIATSISLNGAVATGYRQGSGYIMYATDSVPEWKISSAFIANFEFVIPNSKIAVWPAISFQAGNYAYWNDIGEVKGAAYIALNRNDNGGCLVITDPKNPLPLDPTISVTAPDWNLGDLQQGETDTSFSSMGQQLCFDYSGVEVALNKFIINASSANGVVNNRYRLVHSSDTSQTVPYRLTLDSGSTLLQLPNNSTALQLNGNRTCFVPTFRTEVGKTVKEGDYNDVLNFTITTKS